MKKFSVPVVFASLCLGLALTFLTGCSTFRTSQEPEPEPVPKDTVLVTTDDTTELRPEISRLYALEAEILSVRDSSRLAHLLNQAMSELAQFLRSHPQALERDAVRELYSGLKAEYRRFHGYASDPDSIQMARGRIFAVRARLFASLDEVDDPLLEESPPQPEADVEGTEIPMTSNRLVNSSITYLKDEPDAHVNRWLKRVQVYGPMIEHILAEEGVPPELKYLAMVESGLNPRARSWAGAVGMWQFMAPTARRYDLSINTWVDERQDPEKATRAAARYLSDLHDRFGDWHLALAAYNCGASCVRRALRKADEEDPSYWDAYDYLPRETRGYVPMFIATAHIMENPDAYGFDAPPPTSAFSYDYVPVHGSMLSFEEIASLAGTEPSVIKSLNPELRRSRIPPSKDRYHLRIPLGNYPRFTWNYASLPNEKKQPATTYTVRRGDTLSEIAQQFGTSTSVLRRLNGLSGTLIREGQQLVVPVQEYSSALASEPDDKKPMRIQYGTSPPIRPLDPINTAEGPQESNEEEQQTSSSPTSSASSGTTSKQTYRVTKGDTLGAIAQRFGVTVRQLRAWNDLNGNRIHPDQRLQVSE